MNAVTARLKTLLGITLAVPLILAFAILLLLMLFLMPVGAVLETWDILHMRATAPAEIIKIEMRDAGDEGRPVITYRYTVRGRRYESDRLMPGFMANWGGWTGSEAVIEDYRVGQRTVIHYDPSDPERACLLYGWFKWSIGWSAIVWGGIATMANWPRRVAPIIKPLGGAFLLYGAAIIVVGPTAIPVDHGPWHLLAIAALFLAKLAVTQFRSAVKSRAGRSADAG